MGKFYGVPGIEYIPHGNWSDPEIAYKDYTFDYYILEDSLYDMFKDEFKDINETDDEGNNLYASEQTGEILSFEDWVLENKDLVYEELDDIIDSYFEYKEPTLGYLKKNFPKYNENLFNEIEDDKYNELLDKVPNKFYQEHQNEPDYYICDLYFGEDKVYDYVFNTPVDLSKYDSYLSFYGN